jgi:hypothetical protein
VLEFFFFLFPCSIFIFAPPPPHHFSNGPPLSGKIIEYILRWVKQINNLRKDMCLFSCEKEGVLLERAICAYFACRTCRLRARVFLCTQHVAPKTHACLGRNLPRPQLLSRGWGGEENEKKFFVGRAKNTLHALSGNESQPVIYNCTYCTVRNEGPAEEAGKKQPL